MLLASFVSGTYLPSRVAVSAEYRRQLLAACDRFSNSIGHRAKLGDFSTESVARHLVGFHDRHSDRSTNNERQILLMLWAYAFDAGLTDKAPRPRLIATLKVEQKPPKAVKFTDVMKIVETCRTLPGTLCGIAAADFWLSLVLCEYWTGCRVGAMLATPSANYGNGRLEVGNQKTKKTQSYRLPESCCEIIDRTRPHDRERIWPWARHRTGIFPLFRRIMESAGLAPPKTGHHLFHAIRRTNISYCAAIDPALAQRQANHADYATTLKYYVDESIVNELQAVDVLRDPLHPGESPFPTTWQYRVVG